MLSTTRKDTLLDALLPAARAISNSGIDSGADFVMGLVAERGMGRSMVATVVAMLAGNLVAYLFGYAWLASLIGPGKAFVFVVQPFLWGDVMKVVVAACLMPVAWLVVKAMTGTSFSDRG